MLIAILGWTYVANCLDAVAAPGVPIEMRYKAQGGGEVRLWAESYAFDWRSGYLQLIHPRMVSSDGSTVAQLNRLSLSGLNILWGSDQVVDARAVNLQARLVRLPSGRFEIESLLPARTEEPSKVPFRFRLNRARVLLIDRYGGREWRKAALVTRLNVEGVGDDWVATAGAYVQGLGRFAGRIQSVYKKGVSVVAQTPGMEVEPILAHLQTTPERNSLGELAKVRATSIRVNGPFAVYLPSTGSLLAETNVNVSAKDVTYGQYHAAVATFAGLVTPDGAKGKMAVIEGPLLANFEGSVAWTKVFRIGGRLKANAPSVGSLPLWARKTLPASISFRNGSYDGWLTVVKGEAVADGTLVADQLKVANEQITDPVVRVHLNKKETLLRLINGNYLGRTASGVLVYDFKSGVMAGAVNSTHTTLEPLVARFPQLRGLRGFADLSATLGGTTRNPTINFEARGSATYDKPGWRRIVVDRFDLVGLYRNGLAVVTRGVLRGPAGLAVVDGNVGQNGRLNLNVQARAINVGVIDPRVAGSANLRGTVVGTVNDPQARGRVEIYDTTFQRQGITAATANFVADRRRLRLQNLNAFRGAANVTGVLEYRFADQGIGGSLVARNVQLEDFFGAGYVGSLSAPFLTIGGTVSRPVVKGLVLAKDVVVQGAKIESGTAQASLVGNTAQIVNATVHTAGGTATVSGSLNTQTRAGTFTAHLADIDIDRLLPSTSRFATIGGSLEGDATVGVLGAKVTRVVGKGRLADVVVNATPLGAGPWTLNYDGRRANGSLDVGYLDRYASLSDIRYDSETKAVSGSADLFNFKIQDLIEASLPSMPKLSYDAQQRLRSISGTVNVAASLTGTLENPEVDVRTLQATDLAYKKDNFGNLTASARIQGRNIDIQTLALEGPAGSMNVSGTVTEDGPIALNGEVNHLSLEKLSAFDARFGGVGGYIDLSFEATGQTRSPLIRASVNGSRLFALSDETPEDQTLRLMLDTVTVSETANGKGGLVVDGNYYYKGFQGRLMASAPVEYPFTIGGNGRVTAEATVTRRDLKEIATMVQGIDPERTAGYVEGSIHGEGTLENFAVSGGVNLHADTLGFDYRTSPTHLDEKPKKIDTSLKNVAAAIEIHENRVTGTLTADSALGGSVASSLGTNIEDLRQLADNASTGGLRRLLDNAVTGQVSFTDFHVRQGFVDRSFADGRVAGTVDLGGSIQNPRLSGTLTATNLDTVLPFFETSNVVGTPPIVDPSFDLRFILGNTARIRTVTADLRVGGEGSLLGSLTQPNLSASMTVEKGSIRLPASTVRLDPGGGIDLRYRVSAGEPFASLDVDLTGHSAVTALNYADVPQRYDILLELRGDLLKEGGLNLVASSDPPDLSQEQILSLLGSVDLFTSFLSQDARYGAEDRLRGALIGYALPVVFDPFTSKLASALGLEYLSLEYNQYQQATVVFARALTSELIVQGSRQLTQPPPGFAQQYELRLVYRPKRLKGALSRISFSFGTDQDHPWKFAAEYGARF